MTKAELVKKLEKAYEAEDLFPGVLGNPVTFAARWGLPLSKSYLKFKEQQLARRQTAPACRSQPKERQVSPTDIGQVVGAYGLCTEDRRGNRSQRIRSRGSKRWLTVVRSRWPAAESHRENLF